MSIKRVELQTCSFGGVTHFRIFDVTVSRGHEDEVGFFVGFLCSYPFWSEPTEPTVALMVG